MDQFLTGLIDPYYLRILMLIGINLIIALGLNLVTGTTGQLSMGHAGFVAIGAYTSAILVMQYNTPFALAMLAGAGMAALLGFLIGIPTLRLEGDYLAMVTIGFAEIIRVFFLNFAPGGKAVGMAGIPQETGPTLVLAVVILVLALNIQLFRSRIGRAFFAIREDEIAAASSGINTTRLKVTAFTMGSFLAGLGGALYAHYMYFIRPGDFGFMRSIEFLNMVVLGGLGSIPGTILGTAVLTAAPEMLRFFQEYRMMIYGALLVLFMIFRPNGFLGDVRWYDIKSLLAGKKEWKDANPEM